MRGDLDYHSSGRSRRRTAGRSSHTGERLPLIWGSGRERLVGDGPYARIMTATMVYLRSLVPLKPGRSIASYIRVSKTAGSPSS